MTEDEELPILSYVKNKNVALKSITRAEVIRLITDVLKIREYASKKMKSGKKYVALSKNTKQALSNNK